MITLDIKRLYFEFVPAAAHEPVCPRRQANSWEVTRYTRTDFSGADIREIVFRFACHDCGAVSFETFDREPASVERTHADQVGYGAKPERVGSLWLHPGPRIWHNDTRGPTTFYVTETKERPQSYDAVAGVIGWNLGPRGGIKWFAGLWLTEHGIVRVHADQDWPSRRAAVKWVTEQLAADKAGR